ncbi:MAG: ribonuclease E/G, partial [Tannerellaceae bacterium]
RQRVRPAMDINTEEACPACFGKGNIKSSILFTDSLESKIACLVSKHKMKNFSLHVHPYIAAFINKGLYSLKWKWRLNYTLGLRVIPDQSLAFLEYKFYDNDRNELDMKEEIEMK